MVSQINYGENRGGAGPIVEKLIEEQIKIPQQGGGPRPAEDLIRQRIEQVLLQQHSAAKPPTLETIGQGFEKNIGEGVAQTANYLLNSPRGQKITGALMASQNPEFGKMMYQSGTALESDYRQQEQQAQQRNQQQAQLAVTYLKEQAAAKRAEAEAQRKFDADAALAKSKAGKAAALAKSTGDKAAALAKKNADDLAIKEARLALDQDKFKFDKGKGKSYTQNQQTAARFAARANAAEDVFSDIAKKSADMGGFGTKIGKTFYTQQGRRLNQATENMISAFLRKESGAVISPKEYENANNNYIPSLNDSPEVLAQKEQARRIQIEGLKQEGGGAYKELSETMETISSEKEEKKNKTDNREVIFSTDKYKVSVKSGD